MPVFTLKPLPPFRLDLTVWVLRRLPINGMDRWDGTTYRRVLVLGDGGAPVEVAVVQRGSARAPQVTVTTKGPRLSRATREALISTLDTMLGLNIDLHAFNHLTESDPRNTRLASLIDPFMGFKPPRLPAVFEALVNGIACQQLSLQVGIHLLNRLSRAYGQSVCEHYAFPRPVDLASAAPSHLGKLGFSDRKSKVILATAQAVLEGNLDLEGLSKLDTAAAQHRLVALKGIGRWTAQYILLRGLGRLDVFPADDVGSQNKMQHWLRRKQRPDYDQMHRILAPWRPYRGLIYFYLLLNHQSRMGLHDSAPTPPGRVKTRRT
jgi:DNA-3-methyladenine glycosylase II